MPRTVLRSIRESPLFILWSWASERRICPAMSQPRRRRGGGWKGGVGPNDVINPCICTVVRSRSLCSQPPMVFPSRRRNNNGNPFERGGGGGGCLDSCAGTRKCGGNGGLGSSEQRRGGADGARRTEKGKFRQLFIAGYLYLIPGKILETRLIIFLKNEGLWCLKVVESLLPPLRNNSVTEQWRE